MRACECAFLPNRSTVRLRVSDVTFHFFEIDAEYGADETATSIVNVHLRNSTKYTFEIPDFVCSTMPSGSTRVTVTFLYSFPVPSLKSSAKAAVVRHRIKKGRTFILELRESFFGGRCAIQEFSRLQSNRKWGVDLGSLLAGIW